MARSDTGITVAEFKQLARRLAPLMRESMPLGLSRVHSTKPEVMVEVTYITWTVDGLLRQISYQG
ncbi:ATP dependent DNA ligase [Afipia felis]